ncbi:hypothetical protein K491DRAFT_392681 [Lophiostoma macrostomum CBS 122681]|uniref:Rhodopsin domain-containing protein n=1 Tax=Lophiostoma macrostomum CBS 122681 TaxID=1314788 RepID=A0A6A6T8K5_9PLEO|nr:hypothetical protein K491DRAFT_392681 [Lophiostoma macrostomum CBS 122681]
MDFFKRQAGPAGLPTDPAYYAFSVQGQLRAITLSLMLVAAVAVVSRVYIRAFMLRVFRLDDFFMVVAMICSILACSFFLHVIHLGMGKHIFALPPENIEPLLMWIFIVAILIPLSLCFVKLSVAFFLLGITQRTQFHRWLWGITVFLVVFMLFTLFTLVLGCIPIQANWDFSLRPPPMGTGNAKCFSLTVYRNIALVNSVTNIVTDFVLALLPIPLIWTLQVNKRTKASLVFILSLGLFACAAGIVKTPLLFHFFDDMDSTGNRSWYYAWQIIEMNVGIIAASLPSLKPAFRWLLDTTKTLASRASGNRTADSHGYKRHFSSGYLPQQDPKTWNSIGSTRSGKEPGVMDLELNNMQTYGVTVSGDSKSFGGSASPSRSGRGSQASSDAIFRSEELDRIESRAIVRTTKVTIVTS